MPANRTQGYAKSRSEAAYPRAWDGLRGAWVPHIGCTGTTIRDLSFWRSSAPFGSSNTWSKSYGLDAVAFNATAGAVISVSGNNPTWFSGSSGPKEITLIAWFSSTATTRQDLASFGSTASANPVVRITINEPAGAGEDNVSFHARDDAGTEAKALSGDLNVTDGRVHCILGTFKSGVSSVYMDGKFVTSASGALSTTTFNRFSFGALGRSSDSLLFNGNLYEVRLYDRAMSQSEASFASGKFGMLTELPSRRTWVSTQADVAATNTSNLLLLGVG